MPWGDVSPYGWIGQRKITYLQYSLPTQINELKINRIYKLKKYWRGRVIKSNIGGARAMQSLEGLDDGRYFCPCELTGLAFVCLHSCTQVHAFFCTKLMAKHWGSLRLFFSQASWQTDFKVPHGVSLRMEPSSPFVTKFARKKALGSPMLKNNYFAQYASTSL